MTRATKRGCDHPEGYCIVSKQHDAIDRNDRVIGPCRVTESDQHDCAYVDARNALIPRAEATANRQCVEAGLPVKSGAFGRFFMAEMDRLARERGLVA